MDSVLIVNAIKQGQPTSVQVMAAVCKAAANAHQIVSLQDDRCYFNQVCTPMQHQSDPNPSIEKLPS